MNRFIERVAECEAKIIGNPDEPPVHVADQLSAAANDARLSIDSTLGASERWQRQTSSPMTPRSQAFVGAAIKADGMRACVHFDGSARPFVVDMLRRVVACMDCLPAALQEPLRVPPALCSFCLEESAVVAIGLRALAVYVEGTACQECADVYESATGAKP